MLSLLAILAGTIGAGAVYGGEYAVYTKISAKRAEKKAMKTSPTAPTPQDSILATASAEEITFAAKAIGCQDTADLMTAAANGSLQQAIQNLRMAASQLQSCEPEDDEDDLFCEEEVWEEDPVLDPVQAPEEVVPPAEKQASDDPEEPVEELPPRDKNGKFVKKGNK